MSAAERNTPLPEFWEHSLDAFREDLRKEGRAATTQNDYRRHAKAFVGWALKQHPETPVPAVLNALPRAAPETYYLASGWDGANTYRNLATCALRAFIRWARINNLAAPEFQFPPSVTPPKRRKKPAPAPPLEEEMSEPKGPNPFLGDPTPPPEPAVPSASTTTVPPVTVPGKVIAAPEATQAPEQQPAPYTPPPADVAPEPGAPSAVTQMARPRITDKRQTMHRNPLGGLLPAGDTLRVYRVSDGTDGAGVGSRVPVNDYTETDLRGFKDISVFIKQVVYAMQEPLTKVQTTTYIVEQWDGQGRLVPPPRQILVPNTRAPLGSAVGSQGISGTVNDGTGNRASTIDAVMASFVQRMDDFASWQLQREKERDEQIRNAGSKEAAQNAAFMQIFDTRWRTPPIDVGKVVEDTLRQVKQIASMSPVLGENGHPVAVRNEDGKIIGILEKAMEKAYERRDEPRPTAPPSADPIDTAIRLQQTFAPKGPDPTVVELREQNKALQAKLDNITTQINTPKPTPGLLSQLKEMEELDAFITRRTGGQSAGAGMAEAVITLCDKLPEVINSLARLKAGQTVQAPQIAEARKVPAPAKQEAEAVPTADMVAAFEGMAKATDDQTVLNGTFALINAISTAPQPWPKLLGQLDKAIRATETVDELSNLVLELVGACKQRALIRKYPGFTRRVTDALARNFDLVCQGVGLDPRVLAGVERPAPEVQVVEDQVDAEPATEPNGTDETETEDAVPEEPATGEKAS